MMPTMVMRHFNISTLKYHITSTALLNSNKSTTATATTAAFTVVSVSVLTVQVSSGVQSFQYNIRGNTHSYLDVNASTTKVPLLLVPLLSQ